MATSGKEWRKAREEGVEITFPSGRVAAIRPIEVDHFLLAGGHIPDFLTPIVLDMINGKGYMMELPLHEQLEKSKDFLMFLNELAKAAFVNPKVVDDPQADDEISIDDLTYGDKTIVYRFFSRPAEVLRRFRDSWAKSVAFVDAPQNDGTPAIEVAQNQAVVEQLVGLPG